MIRFEPLMRISGCNAAPPQKLRTFEVMPLTSCEFQLMNFPVIRVQEIASLWDEMGVCRTHGTPRPSNTRRRHRRPPMLADFDGEMDSVLHLIFHARRLRRHEAATALRFYRTH